MKYRVSEMQYVVETEDEGSPHKTEIYLPHRGVLLSVLHARHVESEESTVLLLYNLLIDTRWTK